ncbi:MAG: nucleotide exchange factor GrpE [Deferrisomatales bacterium]
MSEDTINPEPPVEAATAPAEGPSLDAALAARDAQVAELTSELLYQRAEFENFRKRTEKRYRESLEFAAEPLIREIVAVLDNLERAVAHGRDAGPEGLPALLEGLGHVIEQLRGALGRHGVEPVVTEGAFDPGVHEALCHVPGDQDGQVGEVCEKGYVLKGRLLRPAKVTVTKVAS